MKKIFLSVLAVAALASCTKMDTAYEAPQEIGFKAVAGNMTKAAVDGNEFPTTLNMYVFAETMDNNEANANYINNGEFKYKTAISETTTTDGTTTTTSTNVWGGWNSSTNQANPYYWPNVKTLHFAGYSKSGNANGTYSCTEGKLSITNYSPGISTNAGENDLMWFPTTKLKKASGYGKTDKYVEVDMYHTCSWITFLVKGDEVTGASGSTYTIKSLTITNIDKKADVVCSAEKDDSDAIVPSIVWSNNENQTESYSVPFKTTDGFVLSTTSKNVETDDATTTSGNIVLIPQVPGMLSLTYTYTSAAGKTITETVENINLTLAKDNSTPANEGPSVWEPGKHYIYTITIKANEILIAPTPVDWIDSNWNITVE